MACSSSVSAFVANASNSIMKSTVFHLPCLKVSIFHSASAALDLSLNVVLNSFINSSQSWVLLSLSNSSSFFCAYIPATPPLRQARIAVILSSVPLTLLLLRNSLIPLHQSSNFDWSPSNYPGSGTILFGNSADMFPPISTAMGAGAVNISVSVCSYSSVEFPSSICKDPSRTDNASMLFVLLELVLSSWQITLSRFVCRSCSTAPLLQGELVDTLPNVTTLSLSSGCT